VEERKGTPGIFLHYTSTRGALLAPFVKGLVTTVAKVLFKADVEITVETNEKGGVFHIGNSEGGFVKCGSGEMTVAEVDAMSVRAMNIASQVLDKSIFDSVFFLKCWPFFIIFDTDMKIEACGPSLTLKIPQAVPGALLTDIFEVQRPLPVSENFTYENVQAHSNVTFRLVSKSGLDQVMKPLVLRGGMHQADSQILFLCSVHMLSIADMIATGTHMSELPLHDSARDLLFMSETSTAQQSMNNRLEVMLQELAQERALSDDLLFSMLPSTVINDLKEGRRVRGIEYERVTILFSDIVGFTDLSSNSKPQRICNMLDELYTVFDAASNFFDVYKVNPRPEAPKPTKVSYTLGIERTRK
jgi:guanylate cyclase soluble subunit beta